MACVGETRAKDRENYPMAEISELPEVIQAGSQPIKFIIYVTNEGDFQRDDEDMDDVRRKKRQVYCVGVIRYMDDFGGTWVRHLSGTYKFSFVEQMYEDLDDEPGLLGAWQDYGPPEANSEYKLEKSKLATLWWIPGSRSEKE